MATILTFEEWKENYSQAITPELRATINLLHGIKHDTELDPILQGEYDTYVKCRLAAGDTQ